MSPTLEICAIFGRKVMKTKKKMIKGLKTESMSAVQLKPGQSERCLGFRALKFNGLRGKKRAREELETLTKRYENNNKFDKSDFVSLFEVPVDLYGCLDWEVSVGWEEGVDGAEEEVEEKVNRKFDS